MTTTSTMKPTLSRLWRPTMRAGRTPCCASNGDAQNDPDPVGNAQRSPNPDDRFLIPEGWISRCFLCPPRLRLMLPATVQPEVLLGVAANHVLQRIGVALGDGASRVRGSRVCAHSLPTYPEAVALFACGIARQSGPDRDCPAAAPQCRRESPPT